MRILKTFIFLAITASILSSEHCVFYNSQNAPSIKLLSEVIDCYVIARYEHSFNTQGWSRLHIQTKATDDHDDQQVAYLAGYLEGFLTSDLIQNHYYNLNHSQFNGEGLPANVKQFFINQYAFMDKQYKEIIKEATSQATKEYKFWNAATANHFQYLGLVDGYNSSVKEENQIDLYNMQIISSTGDLFDLIYYQSNSFPCLTCLSPEELTMNIITNGHCSALIKLADDFSDVFFAHNSWFVYANMTRILKEYNFTLSGSKANSMIMSSYPGVLASMDDFYLTSAKLVVIETTNSVFDEQLYAHLTPSSVQTWSRAAVANRLANSPEEWVSYFEIANSGTYNCQFMVADIKRIDLENKVISDGALLVAEQIPGLILSEDVTEYLKKGYWASYNIPYIRQIWEVSGYAELLAKRPEQYTVLDYNLASRAQIFRRDSWQVKDIESMKWQIRHNDYQGDELSLNDPSLTISCRYDLAKRGACFGAYDAKVTSLKTIIESLGLKFFAVAGPTTQQPPLVWEGKACAGSPRKGLRDDYRFDWVEFETSFTNKALEE